MPSTTPGRISRASWKSAQAGEIVLTRAGQPVAKIIPIPAPKGRPKAGYGKGTVLYMADDFDAPLPEFDTDL